MMNDDICPARAQTGANIRPRRRLPPLLSGLPSHGGSLSSIWILSLVGMRCSDYWTIFIIFLTRSFGSDNISAASVNNYNFVFGFRTIEFEKGLIYDYKSNPPTIQVTAAQQLDPSQEYSTENQKLLFSEGPAYNLGDLFSGFTSLI